nr:hypothetical protein [Candidatus Acidoferrales bacterium]
MRNTCGLDFRFLMFPEVLQGAVSPFGGVATLWPARHPNGDGAVVK